MEAVETVMRALTKDPNCQISIVSPSLHLLSAVRSFKAETVLWARCLQTKYAVRHQLIGQRAACKRRR